MLILARSSELAARACVRSFEYVHLRVPTSQPNPRFVGAREINFDEMVRELKKREDSRRRRQRRRLMTHDRDSRTDG